MRTYFLLASLLVTMSAEAQLIATVKNGKVVVDNNSNITTLSATGDVISAAVYNQKVYFLQGSPTAISSKITSYDANTKQYTDVISVGMKSDDGYVIKKEIINMIADSKSGAIYFTTKDIYNNNPILMTWVYEINSGKYKVFSDGKVEAVDADGNVTVSFAGFDQNGHYRQKVHYTPGRQLMQANEREYH